MAHLSLTFLGSFQTALDGKPITAFRSARVQGILIYLALADGPAHRRELLASMFWPDESEAVARKNLRQSLYQLRRVLGDADSQEAPHLLVTRSTVQFNATSDHSLDVRAFLNHLDQDQLERAVSLYQGDLLPGFTCDSLPFEAWLRQERERLHRLALEALHELAARSLAQADYRAAQGFAERQLALEPWREEGHRQLMQALASLGERSAALAQYAACRAILEEELGIEPSAETQALHARIRAQGGPGGPRLERSGRHARPHWVLPFVGRAAPHGALVSAYGRAGREGAQFVALLGEAGIGKTRLAHSFLDWAAAQGGDILRGQAFEISKRLSYQAFTQGLRRRLERENAPEDLLSDLWLTQLTRIFPELRDRYPDLPEPTQEEGVARQHLFEAVVRLGQALAQRAPLVIFLDDWHWADAASLDMLHYAAVRWAEERAPILVLLTLRQEALTASPDLQSWLARLKHDVGCLQLDLAAFSALETEQLMRALFERGEDGRDAEFGGAEEGAQLGRFVEWLFEETGGHPFFLVETLKALVEEGLVRVDDSSQAWRVDWSMLEARLQVKGSRVVPGIQELIRGWLERITLPAGELLAAAAVLGRDFSFYGLRRVAELEEPEALRALDELLSRQLLVEIGEASTTPGGEALYGFSHQKVAEVVCSEAGAARRQVLHRRAFEMAQQGNAPAAELAHHALQAGLMDEAFQHSLTAGNEAMGLFAVQVAVNHYEDAWRVGESKDWQDSISGADRQDLYVGLGRAYELAGAWQKAEGAYRAMVAYARRSGGSSMECQALNRLATVYSNGFKDPGQAVEFLQQARAAAQRSGDRRGLADTEWNLSLAARLAQDTRLARHHGERALAMARQLGHPQLLARCLNSLAYVHSRLRQWETVENYAKEARDLYAAAGNQVMEADCQRVAGWSQIYTGRSRESLATLQETFAFSQRIENQWGQAESAWRLALAMLELGRYGEALRFGEQAVRQSKAVGQPMMEVLALSAWGTIQRTLMNLEAARDTQLDVWGQYVEKGFTGFMDWVLAELCVVHASAGDWDRAHEYALQASGSRGEAAMLPMGTTGWYETEALLRGGDGDLARGEVARLGEILGDNRRFRLPWLRSRAVLAQWEGHEGQAIQHLREAGNLARAMELPGEQWSILAALAGLYERREAEAEAQQARKEAADIILNLAGTIDERDLRTRFLAAEAVRPILERVKAG